MTGGKGDSDIAAQTAGRGGMGGFGLLVHGAGDGTFSADSGTGARALTQVSL